MAMQNIRLRMGRIQFSWMTAIFVGLIIFITISGGEFKVSSGFLHSLQEDTSFNFFYDDKTSAPFGSTKELFPREVTWQVAVQKGQNTLCLLDQTAEQTDQSEWTDYASLGANGWSIYSHYVPIFDLDDAFEALGIDDEDNVPISFVSLRTVTIEGQEYLPSGAEFNNVYNTAQGVIIADDNLSPREALKRAGKPSQQYAPLAKWSDVVFLEWQQRAGTSVQNLNYVFRASISNKSTQQLIIQALANSGKTLVDIATYENAQIYRMDTDEGKAILGSPNGQGVGWLLIQHKSQMGIRTVQSVAVWGEEACEDANTACISMVFTIVPISS